MKTRNIITFLIPLSFFLILVTSPVHIFGDELQISGFTTPEFSPVKKTFMENFTERGDIGASCTVYYNGEKVVDIWGGYHASRLREPWEENTRTVIYSVTQGIVSLAFCLAWHYGYFDYDEPVEKYWPAFGEAGREGISIRQLLDMQSGLVIWEKGITGTKFLNLMKTPSMLENELLKISPSWIPGSFHGYSADIQGHFCAVLFQKIDPSARTVGEFIREELTNKTGAEFDLGLPENFPDEALSPVSLIHLISGIFNLHKVSDDMKKSLRNPSSLFYKSIIGPSGYNANDRECLEVEFAAANGVANARGVALLYNTFLMEDPDIFSGNNRSPSILQEQTKNPTMGNIDQVLNTPSNYHLGMQKPSPSHDFGSHRAFGFIGASGSFAYADPETGIAYAYITNKMDFYSIDPRDIALRKTINEIIRKKD